MGKMHLGKILENKEFVDKFQPREDGFKLLGQGEYNINYVFFSKTYGKKLLLRLAIESQMDLKDQIGYEYRALKLLEKTGHTPKVYYVDSSRELIAYGYLVMEYLPGVPLDYGKDLEKSAEVLAKIHSLDLGENHQLLSPKNPLDEIYRECQTMYKIYRDYGGRSSKVVGLIDELFLRARQIKVFDLGKKRLINTELNSGNFLINQEGKSYLIDWEKPIYGYPAQDLGHFLAPTTTFWKTDNILSKDEIGFFMEKYCSYSKEYKDPDLLFKSVDTYIAMNCLRGISWCAMAFVGYEKEDRLIQNKDTHEKIKSYLSIDF